MRNIEKYGKYMTAFALSACLVMSPVVAEASETDSAAASNETVSELLDFVKEKWDDGSFKSEEKIQEAIDEGEEKFDYTLDEGVREQVAGVLKKLNDMGLNSETVIDTARKLYEENGEEINDKLQEMYETYGDEMADHAEEILKENLVEPAKEAAKAAVEDTAKNFWKDLKTSVVSFFQNIFS